MGRVRPGGEPEQSNAGGWGAGKHVCVVAGCSEHSKLPSAHPSTHPTTSAAPAAPHRLAGPTAPPPCHQPTQLPRTGVGVKALGRINAAADGPAGKHLCLHGGSAINPPVLGHHQALVVGQRLAARPRPAGVALVLAVALLIDGLVCS